MPLNLIFVLCFQVAFLKTGLSMRLNIIMKIDSIGLILIFSGHVKYLNRMQSFLIPFLQTLLQFVS